MSQTEAPLNLAIKDLMVATRPPDRTHRPLSASPLLILEPSSTWSAGLQVEDVGDLAEADGVK